VATHDEFENPLVTRYAGREMVRLFSPDRKFRTWRDLWIALAEAERELGLPVPEAAIAELRARRDEIPYAAVAAYEKELRHDVMAHIRAYGDQCPAARGLIHLGATSAFVVDNADLILMREGLRLLRGKLRAVLEALARFARTHRALPALAYTHLQAAQPTTYGKRACLWLQDLLFDREDLARAEADLRFLGVKGATGTQDSFLKLFQGDREKVRELDRRVAARFGFEGSFPVTGQTYPRRVDQRALSALSGLAASVAKLGNDVRLLMGFREMEEPSTAAQVGSSAMPYKKNPVLAERIVSLARHLIGASTQAGLTASVQWLERSLDDSAGKRLYLPEAFLTADALLNLSAHLASGMRVHEGVVLRRLRDELPFLAVEEVLMEAVSRGGDRQAMHERLRVHSLEARRAVLERGAANDLFDRLAGDAAFAPVKDLLPRLIPRDDAGLVRFVGLCPEQVDAFLAEQIEPALAADRGLAGAPPDKPVV
jgi:adenylosuccinate lyase